MSVSKVQFDGNTLINLENDTVAANKMLSGTKAHDKNGDSITGNIASKSAATYTPTTTDQMIAAGQYLAGAQTIKGDANLVAGNIKKDVTIFGKTGTYEGVTPSGTLPITENGTYDVSQYASANVNVSGGGGVETCNLYYFADRFIDIIIYAISPDGTLIHIDKAGGKGNITIMKNSIIVTDGEVSGDATQLVLWTVPQFLCAYYVYGDISVIGWG